jgi:uncharacterized LabA/DUF88 family protein
LGTLNNLDIFYGKFHTDTKTCNRCSAIIYFPTEKQTDVNIASEILVDAFHDRFDIAFIVSADSDLCGPIRYVRQLFPAKKVFVAFPPMRSSNDLEGVASGVENIVKKKFRESQFPENITLPTGYVLSKPVEWR